MIFLVAIIAGMSAVGVTLVLRELPPFSRWNEQDVKPWACDLCMSFWCSAVCLGVARATSQISNAEVILSWMPAFVVAFFLVQRVRPPPLGGPPIDPPPGSDD